MSNKVLIALFFLTFYLTSISAQTLQDAVQQTISSHPEILQNYAQTAAAQQGIAEAEGAYYPSLNFNAGYGREMTDSPLTQDLEGSNKVTLNRREFTVELSQNIFSGGSIVAEKKRNLFAFQSQNFKTLAIANDLALNVTEAYLNVLLHQKLVLLAKKNLAVHERLLGLIEERSEAGVSRQAELDQATSRVELAKANLITAEGNFEEAKIRFRRFVGCWPKNLVEPKIPDHKDFPQSVNIAIHKGVHNHPFVHSAQADIKEARAQHQVAKAGFYPRLDGILTASRNRNLDGLEGKNNDNLAIIRGSYNAFRGGSDLANSRKTAFLVQEALEIRNMTIIDLKETIRLAYNAWNASARRVTALASYVLNTQKTRTAYFEQFKIGQRSFLDLLDTQNEKYRAEIDHLHAKNDELFARFRILNSIGCLIPYLSHKSPIKVPG